MTGPPTDDACAAARWATDLVALLGLQAQVLSLTVTWAYPIGATLVTGPFELQTWITLRTPQALRSVWESTGRPALEIVRDRSTGQPVRLLAHYDGHRQSGLAASVQDPESIRWAEQHVRPSNRPEPIGAHEVSNRADGIE